MNVPLFGYPKTGKTTLFNLLAGARAAAAIHSDIARGFVRDGDVICFRFAA